MSTILLYFLFGSIIVHPFKTPFYPAKAINGENMKDSSAKRQKFQLPVFLQISIAVCFSLMAFLIPTSHLGAATVQYTLTTSASSGGTVSPATKSYPSGTRVSVTAKATTGNKFSSWSGACNGTAACTVTMTSNKAVTANFAPITSYTLTTNALGSGTVSPLTSTYGYGAKVTLTAKPSSPRSRFAGWSVAVNGGAPSASVCTGTGPCTVTVTGYMSVTAKFEPINRVVLLLHGMNSGPDTWDQLVLRRFNGRCDEIYAGVVMTWTQSKTKGELCFRLRFGIWDIGNPGLTGLQNTKCNDNAKGCKGDYTRIFNHGSADLGTEVSAAVSRIKVWLGSDYPNYPILLLGHSRGGLAARAALQVQGNSDLNLVKALVTTGSPHLGSPLGSVYQYLLNCEITLKSFIDPACDHDWTAMGLLKSTPLQWFEKDLDLRKPTIGLLAPNSRDISDLEWTKQTLANRNLKIKYIYYNNTKLGRLARIFSKPEEYYDVWPSNFIGDNGLNGNFSYKSQQFVLCNDTTKPCQKKETQDEFLGDGIVPWSSQRGGTSSSYSRQMGINVLHTEEPTKLDHLNAILDELY